MGYLNKSRKKINLLILIFVLSFGGCGLTGNLIDWKGDKGFDAYIAEREKRLPELQRYIGKNAEDVRKAFGEPTNISWNTLFKGVRYEEEWYYKYDKGVFLLYPDEHSMSFYFNNGKVEEVDML